MRTSGDPSPLLAIALGILVAVLPEPIAGQANRVSPAAEAILARARSWVGAERAEAIRSLSVEVRQGGNSLVYRVMPPARFQVRDPFGVNTLNNGEFWRALTAEAGAVSMSAGGRQETSRVRENVTHTFLVTSMAFLLRPLAGVEVTATNAGLMGVDGLDGDALRVVGPQGLDVTFVFDRHDGHLVGYADQGRLAVTGEAPVLVHAVSRVSDFRLVGGLRFPHRIELSVPTGSQTGPLISVTEVEKIEIDTLTPADFSRDSGVGIGR